MQCKDTSSSLEGVRKKNCLGYYQKNPKYSKNEIRRDAIFQNREREYKKRKHKRKHNDDDCYDDVTQRIISEGGIVFIELLQKRRARLKSFNGEKT